MPAPPHPGPWPRVDTRGSFRGHDPGKICAIAKHLLTHLLNPCEILFKAQELPGARRRKETI